MITFSRAAEGDTYLATWYYKIGICGWIIETERCAALPKDLESLLLSVVFFKLRVKLLEVQRFL